jgi:hypothetical protein
MSSQSAAHSRRRVDITDEYSAMQDAPENGSSMSTAENGS